MALYGDWARAGTVLRLISTRLAPVMKGKLKENGEIVLETIIGHIERQDLNWTKLAERTIELKNGDDTIYVETGYLKDNLAIRKVKSSSDAVSYFIGASPWKTHAPSGEKFSDIMIWMEYGTAHTPARPLIRPSFEEVKSEIRRNMYEEIKELIRRG